MANIGAKWITHPAVFDRAALLSNNPCNTKP